MKDERSMGQGAEEVAGKGKLRDPRYEKWRWSMFALTWVGYAGYYFTRKAFPVAKVGILEDPTMEMSKSVMGTIDGAYGVAYALGQFLWGMMGDRFGSRKIVLGGMMCSILVAVGMGISTHALLFGVLFFFQGLCQSTGWSPLTKNMSQWFSQRERGKVFGFWTTNYAVGGMVASAFTGYVAMYFGDWRFAFFSASGVLLIIWVLFFVFQRNKPEDVGLMPIEDYHGEKKTVIDENDTPEEEVEGSWKIVGAVLRNPMILRIGLVYFLLKPTRYAILFWGPVMVYERLGTGMGGSALVSAAFELAGPVGAIGAGYASDHWFQARRMPVVVTGLLMLSLMMFFFIPITNLGGPWLMALIFFIVGITLFGPDTLLCGATAVDFGSRKGAGSAVGFVNGMGSVGQILGLSLPGVISAHFGWGVLFTTFGITSLLGALILLPKWNAVPAGK